MTIDDVSGGRLIAAIGAGGTGWDATVLGQDALTPPQRVARLDEFVTLTTCCCAGPTHLARRLVPGRRGPR